MHGLIVLHDQRETIGHIGCTEVLHARVLVVNTHAGVDMPVAKLKMALVIHGCTGIQQIETAGNG